MFDHITMLCIHIALSFMALGLGYVAIRELYESTPRIGTELFLVTGVLTTLTGFVLPFDTITPPVATGIISTIFYLLLLLARFVFHYNGFWRGTYVVGMVVNVYLLFFVTVTQAFLKIPTLKAMAPNLKEPPFAIFQTIVFIIFVWIGRKALKRFQAV